MGSDTKKGPAESNGLPVTFRVRNLLKQKGETLTFSQIQRITRLSPGAVKMQLQRARRCGAVKRVAYGLWQHTTAKYIPEYQKSNGVGGEVTGSISPPRYVLHDLVFRSKVTLSSAQFVELGTMLRALYAGVVTKTFKQNGLVAYFFVLDGYKVSLYSTGSLVLFLRGQFYGHNFEDCLTPALRYARQVLGGFFAKIGASAARVHWTARHHYARTDDLGARGFRYRKQKVRVRLQRGFFVFDYSEPGHADHAEAQNAGGRFIDDVWRPFIESLEKHPWTPGWQYQMNETFLKNHGLTILALREIEKRLREL
jgi:hypothetical protein